MRLHRDRHDRVPARLELEDAETQQAKALGQPRLARVVLEHLEIREPPMIQARSV